METNKKLTIYGSLGSNLGDRYQNILNTLIAFQERNIFIDDISSLYEGFFILKDGSTCQESSTCYNLIFKITFTGSIIQFHQITRAIEIEIGQVVNKRTSKNEYSSRIIDIDILDVLGVSILSQYLHIPHPKIAQRDFIIIPWEEIAPTHIIPSINSTIQSIKNQLPENNHLQSIKSKATIFNDLQKS